MKFVFALFAVLFVSHAQASPIAELKLVSFNEVKDIISIRWDELKEKIHEAKDKLNEVKNQGILLAGGVLNKALEEIFKKYPEFGKIVKESLLDLEHQQSNEYDFEYVLSTILTFNKNVYDKLKPELIKIRKEIDDMVFVAIETAYIRDADGLERLNKKLEESKKRVNDLIREAVEAVKPNLGEEDTAKIEDALKKINDWVFNVFQKLHNLLKAAMEFVHMKMHDGRSTILG